MSLSPRGYALGDVSLFSLLLRRLFPPLVTSPKSSVLRTKGLGYIGHFCTLKDGAGWAQFTYPCTGSILHQVNVGSLLPDPSSFSFLQAGRPLRNRERPFLVLTVILLSLPSHLGDHLRFLSSHVQCLFSSYFRTASEIHVPPAICSTSSTSPGPIPLSSRLLWRCNLHLHLLEFSG